MPTFEDVTDIVSKLEGPYKWYVLGIILVLLTAIMTKVIFKTFRWFLILAAIVVVGGVVTYYLIPSVWELLL